MFEVDVKNVTEEEEGRRGGDQLGFGGSDYVISDICSVSFAFNWSSLCSLVIGRQKLA